MLIRERIEQMEKDELSEFATLSVNSRGRVREEEQCDIRPVFQRDRDRILHCKAFRRLMNKTQVFLYPMGDHYRTRMSHTLEVAQNARTIGRALRLNESLIEAIALGHDLGHTPFGHAGEDVLNKCTLGGFIHSEQSVRIVEKLEKDGKGLNLTWEVRDGIRNHQTEGAPHTPEGAVVRISDKIAYIYADVDDAIRGEIITEEDIPMEIRKTLGMNAKARLNTMIHDVIMNSEGTADIHMSDEVRQAATDLRAFLFRNVYKNPKAKGEEVKAKRMIRMLFEYYNENPDALPEKYYEAIGRDGDTQERVICDYIAGMTDSYCRTKFSEFFIPKAWEVDGI
ncbi:MAG: deoxyguanosinetriphosphate triphosphohydrolase [Lachnospiraceae bacterium]|jgi:dGTPase|nr:deoxyguanosinetriphosphate triphosphohydrolase [Lachnospiraceae bacterium]MDD7327235.1 deoxyguanosinetriphosphate triphosphohydrolase [Lachnospiraceae bacterium]MDY2759445.1 deoxyguanosinetriphosphate triphosphohydrolase [Lachnospiraceae bacterium]